MSELTRYERYYSSSVPFPDEPIKVSYGHISYERTSKTNQANCGKHCESDDGCHGFVVITSDNGAKCHYKGASADALREGRVDADAASP